MIIPDLNLLLYAYDTSSAFHRRAKTWLESLMQGDEPVGFPPVVLFGFVRLATSPRVFRQPMSVSEAIGHVHSWLEQPRTQTLSADLENVKQTFALLENIGTGGNLTTDAQIAAFALSNEATLHTADADFARFSGLRWANPITGVKAKNRR